MSTAADHTHICICDLCFCISLNTRRSTLPRAFLPMLDPLLGLYHPSSERQNLHYRPWVASVCMVTFLACLHDAFFVAYAE